MDAAKSVGHFLGLGGDDVQVSHSAVAVHSFAPTPMPIRSGPASMLPPATASAKVEGQVHIKIDGLPPGSRIEQAQGGNLPINIDAGYSSHALGMP